MLAEICILGFSFIATYICIILLKPVAHRIGLLDVPNYRKKHNGAIPLIGGLAVFISVTLTLWLFHLLTYTSSLLLLGTAIIVLVGAVDDARDISVRIRLLIPAVISLVFCLLLHVNLSKLGNLLGTGGIDIGMVGYLVTVLAVIGGINAFNMIDGIDGSAGCTALICFVTLSLLFGHAGHVQVTLIALLFATALLPYLMVNLQLFSKRTKIFLGDAGSMMIGFVIVWLLIRGSQMTEIHSFRTVTALWVIALPLMDMTTIMIRRIRNGFSPFRPDRTHLHHILIDRLKFSHRKALAVFILLSLVYSAIAISAEYFQVKEWMLFYSFLIIFVGYYTLTGNLLKRNVVVADNLELIHHG